MSESGEWSGGSEGGMGRSGGLCGSTMECLDTLRKDRVLCDCVLVSVEGRRFVGHRTVFAACSSFLRAMFVHQQNNQPTSTKSDCRYNYKDNPDTDTETKTEQEEEEGKGKGGGREGGGMHEFEMGVAEGLLGRVVEFAYTGRVEGLGFWDVERLLPLADQWNMMGLVGICVQFLRDQLRQSNCVGIWKFAGAYNCADLERVSLRFLLYHIRGLMLEGESGEVFGLGVTDLEDILSNDLLNVNKEDEVQTLIERWIAIHPTSRKEFVPRLMSHIRTSFCTKGYTDKDKTDTGKNTDEAFPSKTSPFKGYSLDTPNQRPRIPHDVLLAIGGWSDGYPTGSLESYDCKMGQWYPVLCRASSPRAYHGLAVVDRRVYMVGGFDGTDYYNNVRCLDLMTLEWSESAPMNVARCYVSVVALDGFVYAIGGFDGRDRHRSVERYNPQTNQWTLVESMQQVRSDASAATLNGKIYVAGGFDGVQVLMSVEVYRADVGHWTTVTDMSSPRSGVCMEVVEEEVLVVGGFDGESRLASVEKYSPLTLSWTPLPSLNTPRSNFALASLNGTLYAIGGFDGMTTIRTVELYEREEGRWRVGEDMNESRSAVRTCVITGLEDTRVFGFHGQPA